MPSTAPPDIRRPPPARLPRRAPAPEARSREVRLGALAVAGLVVVLLGVPLALALAVGNPLPTSAPSRDWLDAQLSSALVIDVLAVVMWIAWAQFAACVLTEWRAARRGTGLPGDVPLGGGSQLLARRLVAATLLLAGAATLAPAPDSGQATPRPATSVSSLSSAELTDPPSPATALPAEVDLVTPEATKTYQVQPPDGRRYDSLWDIAERTLGDPLRYRELFALNKDRPQPDGRTLVEADLIHPGWTLLMPSDAAGPGVHVAAPPPVTPAVPAQPPGEGLPTQDGTALPEAAAPAGAVQESGFTVTQGLLGGGLLAAGLLVALSARRGPYARPTQERLEQDLRLAADPERADLLDRLLRGLAQSCAAQAKPLPEVALAYLGRRDLTLHLATATTAPPAPWVSSAGDRVWSIELPEGTELPDLPDVAAPYPALVGVATIDDHELLVDLEAATGLVSVTGATARDVVVSMAVELATNTWSDGVGVTLVGFGDDLADVAPENVGTAARLDEVLHEVQQEATRSTAALRASGATDVLAGRLQRAVERQQPRILVLSGPPSVPEAAALASLVRGGRTPLGVLVVGEVPGASWRFHIDAAGTVDLGVFGVSGRARTLSPQEYGPVLALLREADQARRRSASGVEALTPRSAAQVVRDLAEDAGGATPGAAPLPVLPRWALLPPTAGMPAKLTRPTPAAVQVQLLGPVHVTAPGPLDEAARGLLTELVVAVALHREGLHEALLRALVWPRGAEDDVVTQTVAQAQAWLGDQRPGHSRLHRAADGRYTLSNDVVCDVDVLRTVAEQATGARELDVLSAGLSLVQGTAFSRAVPGRYRWLRFYTAASDARLIGTAVARRAAGLRLQSGDRAGAAVALGRGLDLVPEAEALWREMLRVTPRDDLPEMVALMYDVLDAGGIRPEPDTDALVEQLQPGHSDASRAAQPA